MKPCLSTRKLAPFAAVIASSLVLPAGAAITVASWEFAAAESGYTSAGSSTHSVSIATNPGQLTVVSTGTARASFSFSEVSLENVGDWIQVDYQIQLAGNWSGGTYRVLFAGLWDRSEAEGYSGWLTTNNTNAHNRLYSISDFSASGAGVPETGTELLNGTATVNLGNQAVLRNAIFRVERTAEGTLLTYSVENNTGVFRTLSVLDTSANYNTFDAFDLIGGGGSGLNFQLERLTVTTVPEPSVTSLLAGLGLLAFLHRRR